MRQRKFDAALAAVAAIEKKQPDKPLPHNLRGAVLVAKGDIAGARKSFERALALDPTDFPATASLARLDLAKRSRRTRRSASKPFWPRTRRTREALLAIAELRAEPADRRTKSPR